MSCSNVDSTNVRLMKGESGMVVTRDWGKVNDGFCISAREGQLVSVHDGDSKQQWRLFQEGGTKGSERFYCNGIISKEIAIFSSYLSIAHNVTNHPTNVNSLYVFTYQWIIKLHNLARKEINKKFWSFGLFCFKGQPDIIATEEWQQDPWRFTNLCSHGSCVYPWYPRMLRY